MLVDLLLPQAPAARGERLKRGAFLLGTERGLLLGSAGKAEDEIAARDVLAYSSFTYEKIAEAWDAMDADDNGAVDVIELSNFLSSKHQKRDEAGAVNK